MALHSGTVTRPETIFPSTSNTLRASFPPAQPRPLRPKVSSLVLQTRYSVSSSRSGSIAELAPIVTSHSLNESSLRSLNQEFSRNSFHVSSHGPENPFTTAVNSLDIRVQVPTPHSTYRTSWFQSHAQYANDSQLDLSDTSSVLYIEPVRRASMMSVSPSTTPPNLSLPLQIPQRQYSISSDESYDSQISKQSKSPAGNRFTSFFRWQSVSSQDSVPGREPSPSASPKTLGPSFKSVPPMIDTLRANAVHTNGFSSDSRLSIPPPTPGMVSYDSIEEELRLVSAELAASIKREMDLEDLIEKLEAEALDAANSNNREKRTSDYFSDVGTPGRNSDGLNSNYEQELEKIKRHHEQEKAQIRLEMLGKISEERQRRVDVESQIHELEDQVSKGQYSQLVSTDTGKVAKLEAALEDARRKLVEEKQARENFEALVTAIKEELETQKEERDRLRDDVVPKLQAKIQSLETETSQMQQILNDRARLQQELAALRNENQALLSGQRKPKDIRVITPATGRMSLASVTGLAISPSPMSPMSPKEKETLSDKLKEVETQRDELQKALRSLRERQQYESKQAKQKIKALETERDKALRDSPRKFANSREVMLLRREVDRLRHRAEDALDNKFICERNLGSLKKDLERAEQETTTLRVLLLEHDSLVTQHEELKDSHLRLSKRVSEIKQNQNEATSLSLRRAYSDLQHTHELALSRLDALECEGSELSEGLEDRQNRIASIQAESEKAMKKLRQSLADAEAARDTAQVEADAYRKRADALQTAEREHLEEERGLASQLRGSTERVQQLAAQVQMQMESNSALRGRLAAAIERGEQEQQISATRINDLQSRLKVLEDKVLAAQQETEDAIAHHEEEIRAMQESHSAQLTRLKSTLIKSPGPLSPKMPLSPLLKSPALTWTSKVGVPVDGPKTGSERQRVDFLEKRVFELERALAEADKEMEEVVSRMSLAQIEVMELTSQRDEAARQTRRLQAEVADEKAKFAELVGA